MAGRPSLNPPRPLPRTPLTPTQTAAAKAAEGVVQGGQGGDEVVRRTATVAAARRNLTVVGPG